MSEPRWLQEKVVVAIHQRQLAEHGGMAGVRDMGLLRSALAALGIFSPMGTPFLTSQLLRHPMPSAS